MNDRTLDQALDMNPAERAELRQRAERLLEPERLQDDAIVDLTHVRTPVPLDSREHDNGLLDRDVHERRGRVTAANRTLQLRSPGGRHE